MSRDPRTGRFVTFGQWQDIVDTERGVNVLPLRPTPAMILRSPTDRFPRWRLRVFDLCWPWRASRREAEDDALASGNARLDRDDRALYLDACANLQRDPPPYYDRYRHRLIRDETTAAKG